MEVFTDTDEQKRIKAELTDTLKRLTVTRDARLAALAPRGAGEKGKA